MVSSSAPMWSSPGLTREAMESVAISTSARGAVLSWKDWGEGGRRRKGRGGKKGGEGEREGGGGREEEGRREERREKQMRLE